MYLTIEGHTELILNDEYDMRCSLRIKLESGTIRLEKEFRYHGEKRVADKAMQEWAVRTAISWLMELEGLTGKTRARLEDSGLYGDPAGQDDDEGYQEEIG